MTSFIQDVVQDIQNKGLDISELIFILPSKRAGTFLTHTLSQSIKQTMFAPRIMAIEEFVEGLSDLTYCTNTELLFEFYKVYETHTPKKQVESFDAFSKWGQMLLQDFNEIDRYLIPPASIFEYLKDIKDIEHWSKIDEPTSQVKNYLEFWSRFYTYYSELQNALLSKHKGYQGLVYRKAVDGLSSYVEKHSGKTHIFLGFNALNKAEETIIQKLLKEGIAEIYWDIDQHFVNNPIHDAGMFIRAHRKSWSHFETSAFKWMGTQYSESKNIHCVGIPKNIGQVKYIGELLGELQGRDKQLQNTAVVLGDETLLMPLLNSIPEQVNAVNITMGLPLRSIPLAALFEDLFHLHKNVSNQFYFKDVSTVLNHQFIKPLFDEGNTNLSDQIVAHIQEHNVVGVTLELLIAQAPSKAVLLTLLFESWNDKADKAIQSCFKLIAYIKERLDLDKSKNLLALEHLYRFNTIFNELETLNLQYHYIYSIKTLFGLYKELLKTETLDFKGEPLQGLQIMGMLESRVLDFETVIISSVNEGVLPAGKSSNSFIPFDVKIQNGLPTYKEKDAVYTYHFYRLLQRAKTVYILYNTEVDALNGGEKSRFITQLEIEKTHEVKPSIVIPKVPLLQNELKRVPKTDAVIQGLKKLADSGFSPSSLTSYIRNPLSFYYEKLLHIRNYKEVEETIAHNTLGTIIHNCLEDFYQPYIEKPLSIEAVKKMKSLINNKVAEHFEKQFKGGDITKGMNLIVYEVTKRYLRNFLNKEIETLEAGNSIVIIALEEAIKIQLDIPELDFPVHLRGSVDRIDLFNGKTRIIDYKTGNVVDSQVQVANWEDITSDYDKYSKSFQVLCYAYMLNCKKTFSEPVEGGIISFKSLKGDYFIKFSKTVSGSRDKDSDITQEMLLDFYEPLKKLIIEICNPKVDFVEKLIKKT